MNLSLTSTNEGTDGHQRMVVLVLRVLLGGVFIYAGALKVSSPQLFADSIASFRLLPEFLVNPVALGLPVFEILAGGWLVTSWQQRSAAFCMLVLCMGFLVALGSAAARGIVVDCGCFGGPGEDPLLGGGHIWVAIGRDLILLAVAAFLYVSAWRSSRAAWDQETTAERR